MSDPGRPVLELLVGPRVAAGVDRVLVAAARSCRPRLPHDHAGEPAARFATSLDSPGLRDAMADASTPLAVVVDREPGDPSVRAAALERADVVFAPAGSTVRLPGTARATAVLRLPEVDPARHRPVPPFVRARWRRRLGFPASLVVGFGFAPETRVAPRTVATVLALASAAAVRGEHTFLALALGTPVVTDAATAARLGAGAAGAVVIADDDRDAVARAEQLAAEPERCAQLSRLARELIERDHDPEAVAAGLLAGLDLPLVGADAGTPSATVLYSACRELGLPADGSLYAHRLLVAPRMERTPR
jgi:glycosyltransferase involved in cell wall biosynthesis